MKKLIVIVLVIVASLAFAQPVFAAQPYSPPVTYPLPQGYTQSFPEVGLSIVLLDTSGTYTPHINNPAGKSGAEESWIVFTGGGTGIIFLGTASIPIRFYVPNETKIKLTVHIQPDQLPIITMQSSAPVQIYGFPPFTTEQIRILPDYPFIEIIHMN